MRALQMQIGSMSDLLSGGGWVLVYIVSEKVILETMPEVCLLSKRPPRSACCHNEATYAAGNQICEGEEQGTKNAKTQGTWDIYMIDSKIKII